MVLLGDEVLLIVFFFVLNLKIMLEN